MQHVQSPFLAGPNTCSLKHWGVFCYAILDGPCCLYLVSEKYYFLLLFRSAAAEQKLQCLFLNMRERYKQSGPSENKWKILNRSEKYSGWAMKRLFRHYSRNGTVILHSHEWQKMPFSDTASFPQTYFQQRPYSMPGTHGKKEWKSPEFWVQIYRIVFPQGKRPSGSHATHSYFKSHLVVNVHMAYRNGPGRSLPSAHISIWQPRWTVTAVCALFRWPISRLSAIQCHLSGMPLLQSNLLQKANPTHSPSGGHAHFSGLPPNPLAVHS